MNNKKYILLENEKIEFRGRTLYRIQALKDFGNVKAGDLGGYVAKEDNLSHEGSCWIYGEAKVYDNALVTGDAAVHNKAIIAGNAKIEMWARVYDESNIFENAVVTGAATVRDRVLVYHNALVCDCAEVSGKSRILREAIVRGHASILDFSIVSDNASVGGDVVLYGCAHIGGRIILDGDLWTKEKLSGHACIKKNDGILAISNATIGRKEYKGSLVSYIDYNKDIYIEIPTFKGNLQEFEEFIKNSFSPKSKNGKRMKAVCNLIRVHFDLI